MLKVDKKIIKTDVCWKCNGRGCKQCNFTGKYVEYFYHHTYIGKDGKKYCIDGDTIK